jgi:hypothetical protein
MMMLRVTVLFGQLPLDAGEQGEQPDTGNAPIAVRPETADDSVGAEDNCG